MRAIQVTQFGGPEVLDIVEVPDPDPIPGLELIEVDAAGVNYADTHAVENSYLSAQELPFIPGAEVVGRTADGRRLCGFTASGSGGYAERALVAPTAAFEVPEGVSDAAALGLLVQGLTAWQLLRTSARMVPGESVVVHAAAGGVGSLAIQLAKLWGAGRVIAVASSEKKRQLALDLGADVAVDSDPAGLTAALREANGGKRVDIILEMVGGATTDASLRALGAFGRLVVYGMASRTPATPIAPSSLMTGSLSVTGFWLIDCMKVDPIGMVAQPLAELVRLVDAGEIRPLPGTAYALDQARQAHEDMRARRTTGKVILTAR
ncbi:MAG: quinone oxidoreductase family protein [Candidatus Nanopelagicales bacterium]